MAATEFQPKLTLTRLTSGGEIRSGLTGRYGAAYRLLASHRVDSDDRAFGQPHVRLAFYLH